MTASTPRAGPPPRGARAGLARPQATLQGCLAEMNKIIHSTKGSLQAVKKKYSSEKYGQVALMQLKVLD